MSVDVTKPEKYVLVNSISNSEGKTIASIKKQENSPEYRVVCVDSMGNSETIINVPFGLHSPERYVDGIYYLREKTEEELSKEANEYLDETLGTFNSKPNKYLESSLKEDLHRVREALKDSLLRVESQAFAIFVKENKGTDIATDYYNFKKRL